MSDKNKVLSDGEISLICYKLAMLMEAGVSIDDAAADMAEGEGNEREKKAFEEIKKTVWAGGLLSDGLKVSGAFPEYMSKMVQIGEVSGKLTEVLNSLAKYYEREEELSNSLKKAVVYPSAMAGLLAVIFFVLIGKVLPVFSQVFVQMGITLSPLAEKILRLGSASEYIAVVMVVLLAAVTIFIVYNFYIQNGAESFSRLFAKSRVCVAVDRSRFASSMAMMLSSGLPIEKALDMTGHLMEGSNSQPKIKECEALFIAGEPFSKAVKQSGIFDGMQCGILSAGADAGTPERAMSIIAEKCSQEADLGLSGMLGKFEYGLVIALCISVGFVLLSVMLPLLGVITSAGI